MGRCSSPVGEFSGSRATPPSGRYLTEGTNHEWYHRGSEALRVCRAEQAFLQIDVFKFLLRSNGLHPMVAGDRDVYEEQFHFLFLHRVMPISVMLYLRGQGVA